MATAGTAVTHKPLSDPPLRANMFDDQVDKYTGRISKWSRRLTPLWQQWLVDIVRSISIQHVEITLNFPSTAAGSHSDLEVEFPGAEVNHPVQLGMAMASVPDGGIFYGFVAAADVVTVRFFNFSTAAINPAALAFIITVTL